jgi:hypothetical protein
MPMNINYIFQTIAIGWFFGVNKFAGCVEQMTGFRYSVCVYSTRLLNMSCITAIKNFFHRQLTCEMTEAMWNIIHHQDAPPPLTFQPRYSLVWPSYAPDWRMTSFLVTLSAEMSQTSLFGFAIKNTHDIYFGPRPFRSLYATGST